MNLLYLGKYKKRFTPVIDYLKNMGPGLRVLELCFGDTYIAEYCSGRGYHWIGLDINEQFIKQAQRRGLEAHYTDLSSVTSLPKADVCIIMGSLYHFHPRADTLLRKIFAASDILIVSEPVSNLSSSTGVIGFLARRGANAGKGHESFRYNEATFTAFIEEHSVAMNYSIVSVKKNGKDLVANLTKNGNDRP
jgi:hypothetical protein